MAAITEEISSAIQKLIEGVSGDTDEICTDASSSSISDWRNAQIAKAAAIGAGSAAIPVAGYLTLPADIAATLRVMHRAATGISYLRLGYASDETFAGIMGVWSGAIELNSDLSNQIVAKGLAKGATAVGGQIGAKMAVQAFSISTGALAGKKLGPKIAQKVAVKIAGKLSAKAATRWIPIISALAGGGVNIWMTNGICNSAERYCDFVEGL